MHASVKPVRLVSEPVPTLHCPWHFFFAVWSFLQMTAVSCREAHPVTWSDCQGWLPGKHVKGEAETGLCLLKTDMEPKRGGVPREGGSPKKCFSLIFRFHVSSAGPTNQLSIVHAFETTPCSTTPSVDLAMNFNGELPEKWLMDIKFRAE